MALTAEQMRLDAARRQSAPWKKWGPYLSERQWGTVREDYSEDGNAWSYFSHDQARSRAYHWGEDGIAGISDEKQRLCFALALWNGQDPILKERMYGLANGEGNHGEDVKEYYFYLDSTPTHSYMKHLYKYPQREYPYKALLEINQTRGRQDFEYELLDTGIFDDDRYFDVFTEYAKADAEDILIKISVANRGPEAATLDVLPTLWFRNTWSWQGGGPKGALKDAGARSGARIVAATHEELGDWELHCQGDPGLLFTENESNFKRLFDGENCVAHVKDGFHEYVVNQRQDAVNPAGTGTKSAAHYKLSVPAHETVTIRLRLFAKRPRASAGLFGQAFEEVFNARLREADEFYSTAVIPASLSEDEARVARQGFAGMLWTKQYYNFDADLWLREHRASPLLGEVRPIRNRDWYHMVNQHVISMPDKWEYPWYAAWDLAFHCITLSAVDPDFAREQLSLMLREIYMHPSGQIPAYEWNHGDVNPPVHSQATVVSPPFRANLRAKRTTSTSSSVRFLKLELNFNWWSIVKDCTGRSVFEGGCSEGSTISRVCSTAAPRCRPGGHLEQSGRHRPGRSVLLAEHD